MSKMLDTLKVRHETYHVIPWPEKCCKTCVYFWPDYDGEMYCDLKRSLGFRADWYRTSTMGVCEKWERFKNSSCN
jgi:hypothetical protein